MVDTSWQLTREAWRARIAARYHHPRAIEHAAQKYDLGPLWRDDLARRLVQVTPADRDGARLTLASAWGRVEGWWRQSQVAAAEGARRAAGVV